jgi:hypothetical protein
MTDSIAPLEHRNAASTVTCELLNCIVTRTVHFIAPITALENSVTSLLAVYELTFIGAGEPMRATKRTVQFVTIVSAIVGVVASITQRDASSVGAQKSTRRTNGTVEFIALIGAVGDSIATLRVRDGGQAVGAKQSFGVGPFVPSTC